MPIYEYKCKNCDLITEAFLSIKEKTDTYPCKECNTEAIKIISRSSFTLKGGGWYADGYTKT
jgi:putative FmdB family regulatory protein